MYKVEDPQTIVLFGFRTQFGGGKSTGFGLIYENVEILKKLEPRYRQIRVSLLLHFLTGTTVTESCETAHAAAGDWQPVEIAARCSSTSEFGDVQQFPCHDSLRRQSRRQGSRSAAESEWSRAASCGAVFLLFRRSWRAA